MAKEEHRVEVLAYRRALSVEEAKVVYLQKEMKDSRELIKELQRQVQAGPIGIEQIDPKDKGRNLNLNLNPKTGGAGGKKRMKSIETIYSPLANENSRASLPRIK